MKCSVNDGCRHDKPLRISSRPGETIIIEWRDTAQLLSRHLSPSQLKLQLVCDVDDLKTANAVVEPLLALPTLAQCKLRIGRHPIPTLKNLAVKAASQAMGRPLRQSTTAFPFLRLPVELQIRILEFIDLIAPLGEIEWSPKEGYSIGSYCATCDGLEGPDDCFEHHACHFLACPYTGDLGCFCNLYHATFSTICRCWEPPTSLILVSRAIREVAQTVFFSRNRFIIHTLEKNWFGPQSTPDRLEAAVFLKDIVPPSHLPCLHFLELVFPRLSISFLASDKPVYHDWIKTIEYVNDKLNFSKLTLRVCFREDLPAESDKIRDILASEEGRVIQEAYLRILAPFVRLGRLHRFFVDVGSLDEESHSEVVANLERKLEQSVMGEGYNSSRLRKGEERCSAWYQYLKKFGLDDDADETDETEEDEEDEWLDENDEDGWIDDDDEDEDDFSGFSDKDYSSFP